MTINVPTQAILDAAKELARLGGFPPELFTGAGVDIADDHDRTELTAQSQHVWIRAVMHSDQPPTIRVLRFLNPERNRLAENNRKYEGWGAFASASRDYDLDAASDRGEPCADIAGAS